MSEQMNILLCADKVRREHRHQDVELIYVLQGNLMVFIDRQVFAASAGDILVINSDCLHSWKSHSQVLIFQIKIDYFYLKKIFPNESVVFSCNSVQEPDSDYGRITYLLDKMIESCSLKDRTLYLHSIYFALWQSITDKYRIRSEQTERDERITGILEDIHTNYQQTIPLSVMAGRWYMSESSFSRFFKKHTGSYYSEYLRNVRLEHVCDALLHTRLTITEIAGRCGFANESVLNKNFRKRFQMSPKEYRVNHAPDAESPDSRPMEKQLDKFLEETLNKSRGAVQEAGRDRIVYMDDKQLRQDVELLCMNAGLASDLLTGKMQEHVRIITENLGVKYLRVVNLFDERMSVWSGRDPSKPNFELIDHVLDFILGLGTIPILELPENPRKMIYRIGNDAAGVQKSCIYDLQQWLFLLDAFLRHLVGRYTLRVVETWRIELRDDPEQEVFGSIPYLLFYEQSYRIIRRYLPDSSIGACGLNPDMLPERLKQYLVYWKQNENRPQYLTMITYPYRVRQEMGKYELLNIESDTDFVKKAVDRYRVFLLDNEYPETPIWVTEWNTSLSERNIYNDSCAKACHMLMQMASLAGDETVMSYSNLSDYRSMFFEAELPLKGATGMLSKDGLYKPAYYAMEFWMMQGKYLLGYGENYVVTAEEDGSICILAFHPQTFNYSYYMKPEDEWTVKDLPYLFDDTKERRLSFLIRNMKNGRKKIRRYRVRAEEGSVLSEWAKLGYEKNLFSKEISYLQNLCTPRLEIERLEVSQEEGRIEFSVEPNEMTLITITE